MSNPTRSCGRCGDELSAHEQELVDEMGIRPVCHDCVVGSLASPHGLGLRPVGDDTPQRFGAGTYENAPPDADE